MLEDIMSFREVEDADGTVVLIDCHNIAYITVYSTIHSDYDDNGVFKQWRNNFLNKLFYTIKTLKPTKVIFAFDSKNSWRYSLYEEYKANRKKQYGKYPLDKDNFMIALEEMIEEIREIFTNIYTITNERTEGDDIIAILTRHAFNKVGYDVVIVSGDTDLNQLTAQKNVRQYNPMNNQFFNVINPKKELQIKILSGDKSDNIKPIRKGVGVKTAEKILNLDEGIDEFIDSQETDIEKETLHENFDLNTKLIDLSFIPTTIKDDVLAKYNNYDIKPLNGKSVVQYFIRKRYQALRLQWQKISKYIKALE